MSYLGEQPISGAFYKCDDVTLNGIDTVYTITVNSGVHKILGRPENLIISVDNVIQNPIVDYTVNEDDLIFTVAPSGIFWGVILGHVFSTSEKYQDRVINLGATSGATEVNVNLGEKFIIAPTYAGGTIIEFIGLNAGAGKTISMEIANGQGSGTLSWDSQIKWPGGTTPSLTASGKDIIRFLSSNGGSTFSGIVEGIDIK